jgi:hypothetical protein
MDEYKPGQEVDHEVGNVKRKGAKIQPIAAPTRRLTGTEPYANLRAVLY